MPFPHLMPPRRMDRPTSEHKLTAIPSERWQPPTFGSRCLTPPADRSWTIEVPRRAHSVIRFPSVWSTTGSIITLERHARTQGNDGPTDPGPSLTSEGDSNPLRWVATQSTQSRIRPGGRTLSQTLQMAVPSLYVVTPSRSGAPIRPHASSTVTHNLMPSRHARSTSSPMARSRVSKTWRTQHSSSTKPQKSPWQSNSTSATLPQRVRPPARHPCQRPPVAAAPMSATAALGGVATHSVQPRGAIGDVALQHRHPSIAGRQLRQPPFHDGERDRLRHQHRRGRADRDAHHEASDDVAPQWRRLPATADRGGRRRRSGKPSRRRGLR